MTRRIVAQFVCRNTRWFVLSDGHRFADFATNSPAASRIRMRVLGLIA